MNPRRASAILYLAAAAFVTVAMLHEFGHVELRHAFLMESAAMLIAGLCVEIIAWRHDSRYGSFTRIIGISMMVVATIVAIHTLSGMLA